MNEVGWSWINSCTLPPLVDPFTSSEFVTFIWPSSSISSLASPRNFNPAKFLIPVIEIKLKYFYPIGSKMLF